MVRQLEALLGEAAGRTLEFAPILDLESPAGRQLARRVALVLEDFNEPGAPVSNALLLNTYEQLLITGLLMSQPSTYSDMLQRLGTKAAPGSVKRAVDFIEAHLHCGHTGRHQRGVGRAGAHLAAAFQGPPRNVTDALSARCAFCPRA
jgi:hypothetical protein